MKLIIGSHVSFKKEDGLLGSVKEALSYKANTFMFYTGAPQNAKRLPINMELVDEAKKMMIDNGIDINNVIVHAPYIINLANGDNFAVSFLRQEVERCIKIGINKLVLHPGSYVSLSKEEGLNNIVLGLNKILNKDMNIKILLETMAGKGTEIGCSFEDLKYIIDNVKYNEKLGVCLDTCHINDAGYDISSFDNVMMEFDNIIGIERLLCLHINDSKNIRGSKKDRHENFGFGTLGFDNLLKIVYYPKLESVPKILETPYVSKDDDSKERLYPPYKEEIEMIRNKEFDADLISKIRSKYI
ncbi:MAG: deoxyribonuclease IV [Bacilli bacterium]